MRQPDFLQSALEDLDYIHEHYAHKRGVPDVAKKITTAIYDEAGGTITVFPDIGKHLDEVHAGLRATLVNKQHWIFYTYDDEFVYIHRVMASKDLISWDNLHI